MRACARRRRSGRPPPLLLPLPVALPYSPSLLLNELQVGDADGGVWRFDADGALLARQSVHRGCVRCLCHGDPASRQVVSVGADGAAVFWDLHPAAMIPPGAESSMELAAAFDLSKMTSAGGGGGGSSGTLDAAALDVRAVGFHWPHLVLGVRGRGVFCVDVQTNVSAPIHLFAPEAADARRGGGGGEAAPEATEADHGCGAEGGAAEKGAGEEGAAACAPAPSCESPPRHAPGGVAAADVLPRVRAAPHAGACAPRGRRRGRRRPARGGPGAPGDRRGVGARRLGGGLRGGGDAAEVRNEI